MSTLKLRTYNVSSDDALSVIDIRSAILPIDEPDTDSFDPRAHRNPKDEIRYVFFLTYYRQAFDRDLI